MLRLYGKRWYGKVLSLGHKTNNNKREEKERKSQTMALACNNVTGSQFGFINMLLELMVENAGGRDDCLMAAFLITLWTAMNMDNLAFDSLRSIMHKVKGALCFISHVG